MRWISILAAAVSLCAAGQAAASEAILPSLPPWQSNSLELIAAPDDPWITPAERSGLTTTPRYAETLSWLRRLVDAAPQLELVSIGRSDEGRDIWMVVAAENRATTAKQLGDNSRPTLLVQAGIHSGEIDGKDAGLMLLRDMTVANKLSDLLERANLLFIPILNVDGHERFSAHGRINQRGPAEMGWRSNARNLNLNRDYTKLETPGVRAVVGVINDWQPDLYIDVHVTDGVDYQYDITWGYNGSHAWSPAVSGWLAQFLEPAATRALSKRGHVPGPLIFAENYDDYSAGISSWTASPRYSNGYGDARHLATVLVENHSLKPYLQRVLGTYVFLEATMRALGEHGSLLRKAARKDSRRRNDKIVLAWQKGAAVLPEIMSFKGVRSEREYSPVTGDSITRWTGEPVELPVVVRANDQPKAVVSRPRGYYVPAAWSFIVDRLRPHGIRCELLKTGKRVPVEHYRLPEATLATSPFEGRVRVDPGDVVVERGEMHVRPGDCFVPTDQPLGTLAMLLLEPQSPDSLLQWGYFLEIMTRTEYFEDYAVEPMAQQMLLHDAELAQRFRDKLQADPAFSADKEARLRWFYEQTPYFDQRYRLYPIARRVN
ncbi:MAG: M14 family metallopeptidase [Gammaproteobacteria bacterium]|nr:M14 family metallopeptidase [Gammaproteobacteria bacterium]NNF62036.1 M14 family metallopeptidase [Gammaproteobacteria bacterium]NNM20690.1 M14 family metallopeptidase [Gammaproteobacteria bacterium]